MIVIDDMILVLAQGQSPTGFLDSFQSFAMTHNHRMVVCAAQVTTFLVIFGSSIEVPVRRMLKPYIFPVRLTGFILLHTLIFGVLSAFAAGILYKTYELVPSPWVPWVMLAVFFGIGLCAERHKKI